MVSFLKPKRHGAANSNNLIKTEVETGSFFAFTPSYGGAVPRRSRGNDYGRYRFLLA